MALRVRFDLYVVEYKYLNLPVSCLVTTLTSRMLYNPDFLMVFLASRLFELLSSPLGTGVNHSRYSRKRFEGKLQRRDAQKTFQTRMQIQGRFLDT